MFTTSAICTRWSSYMFTNEADASALRLDTVMNSEHTHTNTHVNGKNNFRGGSSRARVYVFFFGWRCCVAGTRDLTAIQHQVMFLHETHTLLVSYTNTRTRTHTNDRTVGVHTDINRTSSSSSCRAAAAAATMHGISVQPISESAPATDAVRRTVAERNCNHARYTRQYLVE